MQQDLRGDVVRKIANDVERGCVGCWVGRRLGEQGAEVSLEDVALVNGNVWVIAEPEPEFAGEGRIELDGVKAGAATGEVRGDRAVAGSDLDDGAGAQVAEGTGDAQRGGLVN